MGKNYLPSNYTPPTKEEIKEYFNLGMYNSIEYHEQRILAAKQDYINKMENYIQKLEIQLK